MGLFNQKLHQKPILGQMEWFWTRQKKKKKKKKAKIPRYRQIRGGGYFDFFHMTIFRKFQKYHILLVCWVQKSSKSAQNTINMFSNINYIFSRFRTFFEKKISRPDFFLGGRKQKKSCFFCYFSCFCFLTILRTAFFCFMTIFEKSGFEKFFSKSFRNLEKIKFMLENTFMVF